ncbi:Acetate--CoA ligase [ADP-forming] I subunit beta [Candidatus Gugararchaeum adminiculabundum]|nr:Acetate--CoA ligase [ADP-forming] I subunit beta [Candidatus Gugararchaeum adminiculabundum]
MDLIKTLALLKKYKIPLAEMTVARSKSEAVSAAKKLGYPVALKIYSKEILHKTDIGGVKLKLQDAAQVGAAYDEIMQAVKGKSVEGVLVQKMAAKGLELIIGGKIDAQFGPLVLFGLGGIYVEVLRDVSLRICPITEDDAREMVSEIKGRALLDGARGRKPVDKLALQKMLVNVSKMLYNEKIKELDFNPVIAYEKGCMAVDVRIID